MVIVKRPIGQRAGRDSLSAWILILRSEGGAAESCALASDGLGVWRIRSGWCTWAVGCTIPGARMETREPWPGPRDGLLTRRSELDHADALSALYRLSLGAIWGVLAFWPSQRQAPDPLHGCWPGRRRSAGFPEGETVLFDNGVAGHCDKPLSYLQQARNELDKARRRSRSPPTGTPFGTRITRLSQ